MRGGVVTIVPSHFDLVIGAFPGTRVVRLVEPEVVREVGLIWVDGDPMLPMAKAMLGLLKSLAGGEFARRLTGKEPPAALPRPGRAAARR
jgi:hypothetical protein